MAKLFPPNPPDKSPKSELFVREAAAKLGDEWLVFHSVIWQSKRGGREADGEADFIFFHPTNGLLVLEVKGGGIEVRDGRWFSRNANGEAEIRNPYEQAVSSKYALLRYLADLGIARIPICHAVAFPNLLESREFGTYGPKAITWCRADIRELEKTLRATFSHWQTKCQIETEQAAAVKKLLAPTVKFERKFAHELRDAESVLANLTEQQIWAFRQTQRNRRMLVFGGAGTGKTVLALERANRLAADGFRCLLTCYNELLARDLRRRVSAQERIVVATFHHLCMREIGLAQMSVPAQPDDAWWESVAATVLVDAAAINQTQFDAIIVDEGQDFADQWIDALEAISSSSKDAPLYIFADHHQKLYRRPWRSRQGFAICELDLNCRNTKQVAARVAALYGDAENSTGASGPDPKFIVCANSREILEEIEQLVFRLLGEGVRPDQLAIIADSHDLIQKLQDRVVGDAAFTSFGNVGIVTETIRRFKGLEAEVAIVAITSPQSSEEFLAECYVGMSRARTGLFVLGSSKTQSILRWR